MASSKEHKFFAHRLVQIDREIQRGAYPNAVSLARQLEVSTRTIQRDIEYMRDLLKAPIEFDAAHNGYFYSEKNYFMKSVPISEGELFSVALFDQLLEQYRNTPLEQSLRSVFRKIVMSLPDNVTVDAGFLEKQTTFIPDSMGAIESESFRCVFSALKSRHVLEFLYRPLQKTTWITRRINPLHVVCQKGNWYVLGFCHDKQDVRMFNLSRMKGATETSQVFQVPADFSPDQYFDKEIGVWLSSRQKYTVELLVSAEIGTFALEWSWNSQQKVRQNQDGSVWVSFETNQLPEVRRWVLGQGATVQVLNPPELVQQVLDEVEKVASLYAPLHQD